MSLSRETVSVLNHHFSALAKTYSVSAADISTGFNPDGAVLPKFFHNGLLALSSNDEHQLTDINIVMVEDRQGEAFLWAGGEPCTSRTNMDVKDRETTSLLSNPSKYATAETQCDIHIPYGTISKWAVASKSKQYSKDAQKNFGMKYTTFVQKRVCSDVLNIGFNGVSVDAETTPSAKLTNVNKGWTQVVKDQKPSQIMSNPLTIGVNGDYANLDAAVADLLDQKIDIALRDDLVCIISDNLIADERWRFYNSVEFHTEKKNTSDTFTHFGGLDSVRIPNFPDNTIVITSLDNLSVYIKESTPYRQIEPNAKRNRVEDYQHREEAYIVENMAKYAALTSLTPIGEPEV
ncbi:phage major capsid protein, P2 family [Vibrio parahaemolyticus]|nr:P2 family phage major capsid protein [Vibrio parahaemolyticus]MCX8774021.1 phage major capsid protein, P2 family [Vibrio parahaemolyticus]MCX8845206.1 phage major capsid protein, P2 family [Vibrio parahaemolyticus]MCX8855129.1 phage major capsid protein, P2 family [Vibrio parahaemolyticus]MCX8865368.1 phage major capsid protein, P2 family [Vibrio parahaemolyticus]MCX8875402.1 phage major capsid protein, P2 family [Vibrio parahaemolyticus]